MHQENRGAELLGFKALKTLDERIKAAFDRLGMAFQGRLSPTIIVVLIANLDKKPARKDSEVLD